MKSYLPKVDPKKEIKKLGFKNAQEIVDFSLENSFKFKTPYVQ